MSEVILNSMLAKGMKVEINPRSDRTRKLLVKGEISEILTSSESHSHGILVKLEDGETGRVKNILSSGGGRVEVAEESKSDVSQSVQDVIQAGENHFVEFKSSTLWSQGLGKNELSKRKIEQYGENTSKVIIAKSISGFLNADGGKLLIGIKEVKASDDILVIGVGSELKKIKDKTLDGYRRMLLDFVIKKYFPSFIFHRINDYLRISFHEIDSKTVCLIDVFKSDKQVFLKLNSKDIFMVRIDASSRQVTGEDLVQYCFDRFK
jgi:uncharacterized repeat protein (TIGR03833 family)